MNFTTHDKSTIEVILGSFDPVAPDALVVLPVIEIPADPVMLEDANAKIDAGRKRENQLAAAWNAKAASRPIFMKPRAPDDFMQLWRAEQEAKRIFEAGQDRRYRHNVVHLLEAQDIRSRDGECIEVPNPARRPHPSADAPKRKPTPIMKPSLGACRVFRTLRELRTEDLRRHHHWRHSFVSRYSTRAESFR